MGCQVSKSGDIVALKRENEYLREQVVALTEVLVPDYFRPQVGVLDPLAMKVLSFWFGLNYDGQTITPEAYHLWFGKSLDTDLDISMQFEAHLPNTAAGMYDHWAKEPLGVVALLILMDQLPRNIYRNSARAFSYDWKAMVVAQDAMKNGIDDRLTDLEKVWIYLVLTHSEDLISQRDCVRLSEEKLSQMEEGFRKMWNMIFYKHLVVIEKFGRFPHRNAFLRRPSTEEEIVFVNDPTYRFDLPVKLEVDPETGEAKFIFLSDNDAEKGKDTETGGAKSAKPGKSVHIAEGTPQDMTDMINALDPVDSQVIHSFQLRRTTRATGMHGRNSGSTAHSRDSRGSRGSRGSMPTHAPVRLCTVYSQVSAI